MAKRHSRLDSKEVYGCRLDLYWTDKLGKERRDPPSIITRKLLDRIYHKNPRARKRMARRYLRKVDKQIGMLTPYTSMELELGQLGKLR